MDRDDDTPGDVRQFKASWRSTTGSLTLFLLFFVFVLLVLAGLSGHWFTWGAGAASCGWLAWALGKPLFTGDWVLRVGPRGVSGYMLRNRTIPWRDVRDVAVDSVQGQQFLVLALAPQASESLEKTRRWASGRKPERRIPLAPLHKDVIPQAIAAAQETFALRGGTNAAAAAHARQQEAAFEAAFTQELEQRTKTTWALYLVVGLNVGAWLLNVSAGLSPIRPTSPDLFRWGAISAWAVTRDGEYWRLLTGPFLHGGLIHLAMNMLGLWGAGRLLNRLYGNPQFLLVYFLSALAGASASLHFGAQAAVSVGASGAVFGVVAALVAAIRKHREHVPKALAQNILRSQAVFLAYALFNGFAHSGIDNAAHVGGLLAGAAMGWVLAGSFGAQARTARGARAAGIAAAVAVAVLAMIATTPSPQVDHGRMFAATAQLQRVMPRVQATQAAMVKDAQEAKAGRMTEAQLFQAMQTVHLPALRQVHLELTQIPQAKGDPRADATADMLELTGKTIDAMEMQVGVQGRELTPLEQARMSGLQADIKAAARRLQERLAALAALAAKKPK